MPEWTKSPTNRERQLELRHERNLQIKPPDRKPGLYEIPGTEIVAYTAGIIDGEGSITIKDNRRRLMVGQCEANEGEWLCRWLQEKWSVGHVRFQRSTPGQPTQMWYWHIDRRADIIHILSACLPYMIVKYQRAKLAIDCLDRAGGRRAWTKFEDEVLRKYWRTELDADLVLRLPGRTINAVALRRKLLGLRRYPGWHWHIGVGQNRSIDSTPEQSEPNGR